jgi:hypothetical protein
MKVSLGQLWGLLQNNIAEVKFARRIVKPGSPGTRRMLCTNSYQVLNSTDGQLSLNYAPPRHQPRFDPKKKNLIVTWDIFMQAFRTINVDQCDLITLIPDDETFWEYFKENVWNMKQGDKTKFMNS